MSNIILDRDLNCMSIWALLLRFIHIDVVSISLIINVKICAWNHLNFCWSWVSVKINISRTNNIKLAHKWDFKCFWIWVAWTLSWRDNDSQLEMRRSLFRSLLWFQVTFKLSINFWWKCICKLWLINLTYNLNVLFNQKLSIWINFRN